ncbi:MAG: hypothetical protein E7Z68_02305 [Thermoplasmata archaeon]|nr:hypothetical protein [Thermoplasmata archaeon]
MAVVRGRPRAVLPEGLREEGDAVEEALVAAPLRGFHRLRDRLLQGIDGVHSVQSQPQGLTHQAVHSP